MAPSGAGTGSPRGTPRAEAHADGPPPRLGCSRSAAGKAEDRASAVLGVGKDLHSGTPVLEGHSSCFVKAASLRARTSVRQKTSPRRETRGRGGDLSCVANGGSSPESVKEPTTGRAWHGHFPRGRLREARPQSRRMQGQLTSRGESEPGWPRGRLPTEAGPATCRQQASEGRADADPRGRPQQHPRPRGVGPGHRDCTPGSQKHQEITSHPQAPRLEPGHVPSGLHPGTQPRDGETWLPCFSGDREPSGEALHREEPRAGHKGGLGWSCPASRPPSRGQGTETAVHTKLCRVADLQAKQTQALS